MSELSKWKTEYLYLAMLNHERFEPVIGVTLKMGDKPTESATKLLLLIDYLNQQHYLYKELIGIDYIRNIINPDIILYQEPYWSVIPKEYTLLNNMQSLFISIGYAFHSLLLPFDHFSEVKMFAWFDCYENQNTAVSAIEYMKGKRKNILVTGLPMSEGLLSHNSDPWKPQNQKKKKIIWAPHHSIGFTYETITYSCFFEICDFMLAIVEKYKDQVQWAFKPHPLLRSKLELVWGRERVDAYYEKWANMENTQFEQGKYVGLFEHSDAMIHDCASFTIEYHYTKKPVMYLVNGKSHIENLNNFAQEAYKLHYMGNSSNDIEIFVNNVINGVDPLLDSRIHFFDSYLQSPNEKKASENIINAILGKSEYQYFS